MRKCVGCSEKFEHTIKYKSKNYCSDCYDKLKNTKVSCSVCKKSYIRACEYTSDEMESKDKNKNFCSKDCYELLLRDRVDLDELDTWLKAYHKTDKLNNRIYMQIQQFKSKNGFTSKGILLTLQYVVSTLKKDLEINTIGIVAWHYDNAKDEYIKKINRQQRTTETGNGIDLSEQRQVLFKPAIDNRRSKILFTDIDFEGGVNSV